MSMFRNIPSRLEGLRLYLDGPLLNGQPTHTSRPISYRSHIVHVQNPDPGIDQEPPHHRFRGVVIGPFRTPIP